MVSNLWVTQCFEYKVTRIVMDAPWNITIRDLQEIVTNEIQSVKETFEEQNKSPWTPTGEHYRHGAKV